MKEIILTSNRKLNTALELLRTYRAGPLVAQLAPFPDDVDDRTAALIVSTNLEHAIEDAVASYFKGDVDALKIRILSGGNNSDGIISSFYAKSWLAHALGVFGQETMKDINVIRTIRNLFAHSAASIDFQTPAVSNACVFGLPARLPVQSELRRSMPLSSRDLFIKVGSSIGGMINAMTFQASRPEKDIINVRDSFSSILI
jgi:hypothetical protein